MATPIWNRNSSPDLSIGLEIANYDVEASQLETIARGGGYAFAGVSLLRASSLAARTNKAGASTPFAPNELLLATAEDAAFAVGVAHSDSQDLLRQQSDWSFHLGIAALIIRLPSAITTESLANFARGVAAIVPRASYTQVLLRIPLSVEGWKAWNTVRSMCGHLSKLTVALEFTTQTATLEDSFVDTWIAEPVKLVILPTDVFLFNKKNFPVLSKRHQAWSRKLMSLNVQFLVSSPPTPPVSLENGGIASYRLYVDNLHKTRPTPSVVDQFAHGFDDYLQAPLQPLMDNLESATYEVFEKDPVKYQGYEDAIELALKDRVAASGRKEYVVMVFGAGRGPLVDCALRAAEKAGAKLKVYALEKNPNAIVILQSKKEARWKDTVTIVHSDMRYWNPIEKADILVSELLGSFGDNELSPECLDGAQKVLKDDGISIPESYTAFMTPISSSKLHNDVLSYKDTTHLETPYVVKLRAIHSIAEPVPVWTFTHPVRGLDLMPGNKDFNAHNTRYSHKLFDVKEDVLLHGIAGYFESVLYRHIQLSINPATHSPDMSSWFPIFFPLAVPLHVQRGQQVDVHFWRLSDERKVWYEWAVVPRVGGENLVGGGSVIHNVGGRSSWIGL
ncbi:PRMT5 arginine-N-methyltransferase-domain-containing protein [Chytriomyces sp. MP71]|nr:PRMT5 arginine-N-methyltransferase-domain-containing protein [Chytriomyces sp. MP71]